MSGIDDLSRFLSGGDGPEQGGDTPMLMETASVTDITPGAAEDGVALVTVAWRGGSYKIQYFKHYTPVLNDVVVIVHQGGVPYIFGSPTGKPI